VRAGIDPSFENDPDMVATPPGELASADRSKVVERDEKIYRKKPEFIRIHSGANLGDVVSDARMHLSSPAEEQQAVHGLFDHLQVQSSVRSRAGFGTSWSLQQRRYRAASYRQSRTRFTMNCAILTGFVAILIEHERMRRKCPARDRELAPPRTPDQTTGFDHVGHHHQPDFTTSLAGNTWPPRERIREAGVGLISRSHARRHFPFRLPPRPSQPDTELSHAHVDRQAAPLQALGDHGGASSIFR
jgi:hypothetical protein